MRSRWRSSPWKWRNDAVPRGRGQKAPSTTRCIKTDPSTDPARDYARQKAPSTTRCIMTSRNESEVVRVDVRKHPAPQGALRPDAGGRLLHRGDRVRKHPAPQGALRQVRNHTMVSEDLGQKAPSTTRCIKTSITGLSMTTASVRKHPSPEGALRRLERSLHLLVPSSESTQHHKVH